VRMAVEWGWDAAVSLTAASSGMSWSGHPVLVVREVSAEKVSSAALTGSDVASPKPRRARLVALLCAGPSVLTCWRARCISCPRCRRE
jgi:hypothetical protein